MMIAMKPPTAQNYIIGIKELVEVDNIEDRLNHRLGWIKRRSGVSFEYPEKPSVFGDAYIESPEQPVNPESLYKAQLEERLEK